MIGHLQKALNTPQGNLFISIILGLGFAAFFRKTCNGRSCIVYSTPEPSEVEGKIYGWEDKCYTYKPTDGECKESLKTRIRPKPMKG